MVQARCRRAEGCQACCSVYKVVVECRDVRNGGQTADLVLAHEMTPAGCTPHSTQPGRTHRTPPLLAFSAARLVSGRATLE
jgi:hypothetical protein